MSPKSRSRGNVPPRRHGRLHSSGPPNGRHASERLLEMGDEEEDGVPKFVIRLVRAAYVSDIRVSLRLDQAGEQFTNMSVFAVPPRESCMICVSLWFR
mmetsp:Transcript_70068/g.205010  ORF Transcript_70068/g.205010 Transcript_70068/m.205010 type:complete len:98 (-) Transcript_70068:931-1224(-)